MTKRLIALLCVVASVLSLFVGCGGSARNTFVDTEEKQELLSSRTSFTPKEVLPLCINGVQAIYEQDKRAYFFSITDSDEWEVLTPTVEGYKAVYTTHFELEPKAKFLSKNRTVTVLVYNDTQFTTLSVYFTSLPVMALNTKQLPEHLKYHDDGEPYEVYYDEEDEPIPYEPHAAPSDDLKQPIGLYETFLEMTLLDPLAAKHGYENGFTSLARAHIRGRSSRAYPKSSYKIELLQEENGVLIERDATLLGMRADGDWNLNGMYAEPTKIRDKVATDLWLAMTADYEAPGLSNGYRSEYVEIIINGHYYGLYLMTERIDRKQLELQEGDRLYFSEGDLGKIYQEFLQCEDDEMEVAGYSLDWPKERKEPFDEWQAFADLTKLIDATKLDKFEKAAPDMIDIPSLANYELFVQAATGIDNRIQNTFYVARKQEDGSFVFSFIPWDMDQTFGNRWHGEEPLLTGEDYQNLVGYDCNFWVSDKMSARNAGGYHDHIVERYEALRKTVLSDKNLQALIDDANAAIVNSGAFMRNKIRWEFGAYNSDTKAISNYVKEHMAYLDTLYR